ncbi:MAG TPA: ABC transporter permease [Gemmatimonadaceae bacterium]|nr:ABC transporter permease [Gemmatimonadaceae bacterium]
MTTPEHLPPQTPPPGLALVRLFAPIVPSHRREEWIAEWNGELQHAWREARSRAEPALLTWMRLTLRSVGAVSDATWLRRHDGGFDMLSLDLKYALRSLRRRPSFATTVVLTLALGIGATTAIFSVVNGVLLRPLPLTDPERVVMLHGQPTDGDVEKVTDGSSFPDFLDIRAQARSFSRMGAWRAWTAVLTTPGAEPATMRISLVTSDVLPLLDATPIVGRSLQPADEHADAPAVAVMSAALWRSRFGGDPSVVGRAISLDGNPVTIVGVVPTQSALLGPTELWRPIVPDPMDRARGAHRYLIIARLAPNVTRERAETEVRTIARRLEQQYPADNAKRGARLQSLQDSIVGEARPALLVLLGAVVLVLLIGCANLANLFLVRAAARERETAVRAALGAGFGQLIRHLLAESLLLTIVGGAAGLVVAWGGMKALLALAPRTIPRADQVALDGPVLLFLLVISVLTGLAFGLLPALQLRRANVSLGGLRDGARGATTGRARRRWRTALVVSEVALATVLVIGASLLVKRFWQLQTTDPGFNPSGLLVAKIELPRSRYEKPDAVVRFYEQLRRDVDGMPGVQSSSIAYEHPLGEGWTSSFTIEGRIAPPQGQEPEARVRPVQPGYFRNAGIRLLRGRDVSEQDRGDTPGVVVINESFARRHFPGENPIGRRLVRGSWWPNFPSTFEIVGVAADERFMGLAASGAPATYFPHAQFPMNEMWLLVRASGDARALIPALRAQVWRLDSALPMDDVQAMPDLLGRSVAEPRFNSGLVSSFAGAALLLAAIGIYGVLSYTVTQRTGEIGVRMALGASRANVLRLVVAQGLGVAVVGVAIGTLGAFSLARALASLLYGMNGRDPVIFGGSALLLTSVAALAAYVPALRASRIEPVEALRYE